MIIQIKSVKECVNRCLSLINMCLGGSGMALEYMLRKKFEKKVAKSFVSLKLICTFATQFQKCLRK